MNIQMRSAKFSDEIFCPNNDDYSGVPIYYGCCSPETERLAYSAHQIIKNLDSSDDNSFYIIMEIVSNNSLETLHHLKRVGAFSSILASLYGFNEDECSFISRISVLHDIGKVAIPNEILTKPSSLTDREFEIVKQHSAIGGKLIKEYCPDSEIVCLQHHEKYDGTGYPNGLKGDEIDIRARICGIVDVFDALCSRRIYKDGWPLEEVKEHMRSESGKHFDPKLLELFLSNMELFIEAQFEIDSINCIY